MIRLNKKYEFKKKDELFYVFIDAQVLRREQIRKRKCYLRGT